MKVILTILILSLACISCRRPDNSPELRDPIYLDLKKRLGLHEKELKFALDERKSIQDNIKTLHPQTGEYKMRWKTYYDNEKIIFSMEQKVIYLKIAMDKRKKEARISYLEAFKENREDKWPDPNDFARYRSRMENNSFLKLAE